MVFRGGANSLAGNCEQGTLTGHECRSLKIYTSSQKLARSIRFMPNHFNVVRLGVHS